LKRIEEIGFKNHKHKTKVEIWNRFGYYPPNTTLKARDAILKGELDPSIYYSFNEIKEKIL